MSDRHLIVGDGAAFSLCPGGATVCRGGAIFVYERFDDEWFPVQTIVPPDVTLVEGFGVDVALDPLDPTRMMTASAVRIVDGVWGLGRFYEFDGEEWREVSQFLPPPDAHPTSNFGRFIALRGDTALVVHGTRLYHYREVAGQWEFVERIFQPDVLQPEGVAFTAGGIELGEDWAFITAPRDSSHGHLHGAVAVYRREADGSLTFAQHLLPPPDAAGERQSEQFGTDIAFDGRTLVVGSVYAEREYERQGVAYVYEFDGDQWALRQELRGSEARRRQTFGNGISVDGDRMIVGLNSNLGGFYDTYLFERGPDDQWREKAILRPGDVAPAVASNFGKTSTMNGRWVVVGASYESPSGRIHIDPGGAAYVFDLDCILGTNPCPVDMDGDGQLTIFDVLLYFNLFAAGDPQADFDGDGELTLFDFLAFQTAFAAGCE
ncbi:MAG: hypothetical protein KIT54_04370 [Phycisphaeraceae bacterium]|nr:hypothetical protein [Phycisphaeraceae bacterium]